MDIYIEIVDVLLKTIYIFCGPVIGKDIWESSSIVFPDTSV